MDPLEKVKPGDPPDRLLDATTFNTFIDAAKWVRDRFRGQVGAGDSESVVGYPSVYVHVRVAGAFPPMSVLAPTAAAIDPVEEPAAVQDHPVFDAAAPAAATDLVLITLAAAAESGDVVKAVAMGVAVADVDVSNAGHGYAVPSVGVTDKLASAANGQVKIIYKPSGTGVKRCIVALCGQAGTTGGGSVTVAEADGSPSLSGISTIQFDSADGFVVSLVSTGVGRVDMQGATTSQAGIVTTGSQHWAQAKTVDLAGPGIGIANAIYPFMTDYLMLGDWSGGSGVLGINRANGIILFWDTANSRLKLQGGAGVKYSIDRGGGILDGATGTFTTTDGKTVTVTGGIITSIV